MGNGANMYWILMVVEHALDVHPGMSPRAKTRAAHLNSPGHTTSTSILTRNPHWHPQFEFSVHGHVKFIRDT